FVVRTAAVHDENPEIVEARRLGIPVFERAQAWGYIMRGYKNAFCIAGAHGKTTTTSMTAHILMAAQTDPTIMVGGTLPLLKAGHRIGGGDTIVMESCEYYNSFLSFSPTIATILNVDEDHLDFFKNLDEIKASFRKFAELVPKDTGYVVVNGDNENAMDAIRGIDRKIFTFGLGEGVDFRGVNVAVKNGFTCFDIKYDGEFFAHIELKVPGLHNVINALAAAAGTMLFGVPADAIISGLSGFTGASRRFEYKGEVNGAKVYDDYAHHPSELRALIAAVRTLDFKRIILAFQPHTYSRTKSFFKEFADELSKADKVFLAEIYAAREQNAFGISSADLAREVPGAVFCPSFTKLDEKLRETAREGDIILTVGAGNIYLVGEALVK
ncbi:MAG: UDP-N-acetylmuramate--L-alanine ligase, partial [Oscillospiraceae bacterium]|nr:UDP-N-acetylmuramate--L-alanine ligase [Oscillospiraceae bacterium]